MGITSFDARSRVYGDNMSEKTKFEQFCDDVELMTIEEIQLHADAQTMLMNAHTMAANDCRKWVKVLRDAEHTRMWK